MQFTSVRRPLLQHTQSGTLVTQEDRAVEGSSNLFYYLFEDYSGAVSILNTSKQVLDELVRMSSPRARAHHQVSR